MRPVFFLKDYAIERTADGGYYFYDPEARVFRVFLSKKSTGNPLGFKPVPNKIVHSEGFVYVKYLDRKNWFYIDKKGVLYLTSYGEALQILIRQSKDPELRELLDDYGKNWKIYD